MDDVRRMFYIIDKFWDEISGALGVDIVDDEKHGFVECLTFGPYIVCRYEDNGKVGYEIDDVGEIYLNGSGVKIKNADVVAEFVAFLEKEW